MIARTRNGTEIHAFIPCAEPQLPPEDADIPLTFSVVAVQYEGGYLFVYNPEREAWELPGGGINPGETLEQCARREVEEESGQIVTEVTCKGVFKIRLGHTRRYEYGAFYSASIEQLRPFVPNEEASALIPWNLTAPLEGNISELSATLLRFV
jgi:8-oxo-dGTP diphosphatase